MVDDLFHKPPGRFADPRLQSWDERLSDPEKARLEVDWPHITFGQTFPEMTIHLAGDDHQGASEPISWDEELNALLLSKSVRALDPEQEAVRCSLMLRARFRRAENDFGDGYFNGVFFAVLREVGLAEHPSLRSLVHDLDYIKITDSDPPSERYRRCSGIVRSAIEKTAYELATGLRYPHDQAKGILVAALIDFIDRRFSVSYRRSRGLL